MRKLIGIVLFVALLAFLYKTCPLKEAHAEALSEVIPELINERLTDIGLGQLLDENGEPNAALQELAGAVVDVDDYILFSIGRENFTENEHVVSFGIAGHVFTVNDEVFQKTSELFESAKEVTQDVTERLQETLN